MEVETLLHTKSKAEVAAAVRAASSNNTEHGLLEQIVDRVLATPKSLSDVDDDESLDWCQWLIAGGSTPEEFSQTVKHYDKATTCGLVWTENFVAYRCRTCGISPYLSLCTDCFQKGNHEGHDFIVFRSTAAMQRAQMLSSELNPNLNNSSSRGSNDPTSSSSTSSTSTPEQSAPPELFSIANGVMPRLFHRLIAYLRLVEARKLARAQQIHKNNMKPKKTPRPKTSPPQPVSLATAAAMMANTAVSPPPKGHKFIKLLQSFSDMGVAMRRVMTSTLTNPPVYKSLCGILNPEYERVGLQIPEHHQTFLEELVYWTVKREFPDDLKCLLLSLRTDTKYNEAFARAFITHYELISQSILKSSDPERLCKHIAAVSVQLFSNEKLAIAMVEQMQLLHLLLRILFDMIRSTAVPISSSSSPSSLLSSSGREEEISLESEVEANDISNNSCNSSAVLKVIDCDNDIIKNNYYWLIKSDLKELLSHGPVATKFFKDGQLLSTWFEFLTLLQGMNVNKFVKKGEPHIERESASYVGAFMAELVISATLMWTLVSHLKDCTTSDITRNFVRLCWKQLNEWYNYVKYPKGTISFHLPLHRYFSTFVRQGLQYQGMSLNDLLPNEDEFTPVVEQVLRLQVAYYGISTRLWARNGPSLVNQAEYYVSSLCCNSMVDADLFLLQVAAVKSPGVSENKFVEMVLREFGMTDVLSIRSLQEDSRPMMMTTQELEPEEQMTMLENCLIFLATLSSVRTNIGICDEDLMALEMSVLLCKSDKLHSELMEMRTERCGSDGQLKNFETVLAEIADFQAPRNMQQGMFTPKPRVWEEIYDPLYTLLRSSNRAEYQCSRDRYQDYVNRSKKMEKSGSSKNLWPPFRIPTSKPSFITDPGRILLSKAFMEVTFVILYHGVNTGILSELTLSLCIYMLELCTFVAERGEDLHSFLTEVKIANKEDGNDDDEMVSGGEDESNSESIVSLLLQLYTKLSESRKSYCLKPENDSSDDEMPSIIVDSRIGDGPIFIAKVLDKLAEKSEECRAYILSQIQRFQGDQQQSSQQELSTEEKEREERRRKAKERTLNWMNENAMKRPQIDAMEEDQDDSVTSESGGQQDGGENLLQQFQDHQCCICFEKLESKPNNPFGLMTHLSPCSILGYQRLRTPEGNGPFLKSIHSETLDEFLKYYVDFSIIQHVPLDPGFGAQLESCGHFIHQACFTGYMNSVKKAPPPSVPSSSDSKPVISFTYKEYTCPVCRQLGNSFLPIILNNLQVKSGSSNNVYTFGDISKLLKKRNNCPLSKAEKTAVDSFIKDMDACAKNNFETDLLKMLKDFVDDSPLVSSFLLTSHLRLALERQLKLSESVSNSSGASSSSSSFPSKKLSYMLPLIAAIKHQYKSLPLGYAKKLAQNWEMVCGKRNSNGKREVPTLLRDVETTLFHFILSVPLENGGVNVFNGVVQAVYNLRVVQVLAAICSQFSERERREISRIFPQSQFKLEQIMSLILRKLEGRPETTVDILNGADENGNHKNADIPETQFIENLVQSLLIPFLRTAAQLKLEIFRDQLQSFPETFSELVTYLQLGERKMSSANNVVTLNDSPKFCVDFLHWRNGENSDPVLEYEGVIGNWCSELIQSFGDSNGELPSVKNHWAAELLKSYLYIYDKPSLIRLPREYDTIFETYRKIKCGNCELVPSTPALCLVCGEVLCLNELCCFDLELKVSEVISHCQKKCGRGTGLFLSVLTSEILIVKEKEACIWGSIFLDSFCEEDLELRRGKPLFLCQERLDILQRNWIAQSFYKANLKWFQHRNFL
ncbi:E3 ubiquitin-protein ligase UBR3 [Orchesella cincta]|uniref:E3 ubiquitin-protein ligase n=1 Tax=Orchesella cincta TaxID=48709 RepID=A0A1D2MP27_ORCCI|nr:E3 ubiquitin-protein ligase UBR3 [Orchesella cincta]